MSGWLARTYPALTVHHFRVLWFGSFLAFTAFFMSTIVQSVVAFELTGTNRSVGIVVFGQGLAQLLLGPFGGAVADRLSKRKVILLCQTTITLVFFVTALFIFTDAISIVVLTIGSFITGVSFSFMGPARQAFVIQLVGVERRPNAVALNQVALNGARVIGPAIGGVMLAIAFIGPGGAYLTMAAIYTIVVSTLAFLPPSPAAARQGRSVFGDLADGVRYCAGQPRLRLMVLFFIFVMMIGFPYVTVLPGLVENQFGRPASSVGIISSVVAGGGFAASLVAAPFVGSSRARILYTMLGFGFGLSLILMALAPVYALIYVPALLVGLTSGGFQTLNGAVIVSETDPAYFGRVLSLQMLAFAGFGLMALPLGILADAFGERITLGGMGAAVCAVVVLFGTLIARASRTPIVQMPVPAPSGGLAEDRVR